jgi:hypothetical protein
VTTDCTWKATHSWSLGDNYRVRSRHTVRGNAGYRVGCRGGASDGGSRSWSTAERAAAPSPGGDHAERQGFAEHADLRRRRRRESAGIAEPPAPSDASCGGTGPRAEAAPG